MRYYGIIYQNFRRSLMLERQKLWRFVEEVNSYEERMKKLKDSQFPEMTAQFKEKLQNGNPWMIFCPRHLPWSGGFLAYSGDEAFDVQVLEV